MGRLALADRKMKSPITHAAMAQRYFGWARSQLDLAEKSLSPKVREDHLALAGYYLKLGDTEVAATKQPTGT